MSDRTIFDMGRDAARADQAQMQITPVQLDYADFDGIVFKFDTQDGQAAQEAQNVHPQTASNWQDSWLDSSMRSNQYNAMIAALRQSSQGLGGLSSLGSMYQRATPAPPPLEVAAPVATLLEPQAQEADPDSIPDMYEALCQKLGIVSVPLLEQKMENFLREEFIPVYEYEKVTAYLQYQCSKLTFESKQKEGASWRGHSWHWRGIRYQEANGTAIAAEKAAYTQKVPVPVLLTIDKIQSAIPEARFFISEIKDFADPFLAVTIPGSTKIWVCERWDEPSFRG